MNSGDLKMYKYVKISKLNFFMFTILSLHSICLESENKNDKNDSSIFFFKKMLCKTKINIYLVDFSM